MNIISKPDLSCAAQYGRYIDFIESKKMGCHTPVRRSCRHRKGTPHHSKCGTIDKNVSDDEDERDDTNSDTSIDAVNLDDLCTMFQATLKVDNHTLEVKATSSKRLSPEPKFGRYVTTADTKDGCIMTPVKRSTRNVSFGETTQADKESNDE